MTNLTFINNENNQYSNNNITCGSNNYNYCNNNVAACDRKTIQCVLVGDAKIGKTSLVVSYTTNGYPGEYVPTAYDKYSVNVKVDDQLINLELCDTAGRNEFDSLRLLSYLNADVFLLCFSVASRRSFARLQHMWFTELKSKLTTTTTTHGNGGGRSGRSSNKNNNNCRPKKPVILVGTQCDLRTNLETIIKLEHIRNKGRMEAMVNQQEAIEFSTEIQALTYIECSALTQRNLKLVFDAAILAGLFRTPNVFFDNNRLISIVNNNTNSDGTSASFFNGNNRKICAAGNLLICGIGSSKRQQKDSFYDKNNNHLISSEISSNNGSVVNYANLHNIPCNNNEITPRRCQIYQPAAAGQFVMPTINNFIVNNNNSLFPMFDAEEVLISRQENQRRQQQQDDDDGKIKNVWKKFMKFFS